MFIPALAILSHPAPVCFNSKPSSSKYLPNLLVTPVPSLLTKSPPVRTYRMFKIKFETEILQVGNKMLQFDLNVTSELQFGHQSIKRTIF